MDKIERLDDNAPDFSNYQAQPSQIEVDRTREKLPQHKSAKTGWVVRLVMRVFDGFITTERQAKYLLVIILLIMLSVTGVIVYTYYINGGIQPSDVKGVLDPKIQAILKNR